MARTHDQPGITTLPAGDHKALLCALASKPKSSQNCAKQSFALPPGVGCHAHAAVGVGMLLQEPAGLRSRFTSTSSLYPSATNPNRVVAARLQSPRSKPHSTMASPPTDCTNHGGLGSRAHSRLCPRCASVRTGSGRSPHPDCQNRRCDFPFGWRSIIRPANHGLSLRTWLTARFDTDCLIVVRTRLIEYPTGGG